MNKQPDAWMNMAEPRLDVERHIKYWQRCLRTFLPTQYTSTDSSRMTLGFFILSALDLLGAGADTFSEKERTNIKDWILQCQHPNGGFCGSPNHRFPDAHYVDIGLGKQQMDPANLPATYFAITSLNFVGGLDGIMRHKCLRWLKSLQREDGSFGELVTQEGKIEGGRDMRYCHVATAVRWMLRGSEALSEKEREDDINIEGLVNHLRSGQTYDGGISESSHHEAHAGYTYCAIAALSFLNRLPNSNPSYSINGTILSPGLTNITDTIRWLISRQVGYSDEEKNETKDPTQEEREKLVGVYEDSSSIADSFVEDEGFIGFNGRCNKAVDTCYAFWVSASLNMLGSNNLELISAPPIRRFLCEQTQHRIGGFGKFPGGPPDIYHSYLGLAALATLKEPRLKPLNSPLCISEEQRNKIEDFRKAALVPKKYYWKHGFCFSIREDDPDFEDKMASGEEPPAFLTAIENSLKGGLEVGG